MKRLLRLLMFAMIVGAVVLVGALVVQPRQNARQEAQVESVIDRTTIQRGDLSVSVSATGSVTPEEQLPLFFEGSGEVAEVLVHTGDRVAKGDVIARLDTSDLDTTIAEAEIALQLQQIAYDALSAPPRDADLAAAQAAVDSAQAALNAAYTSTNPNAEQIAQLQSELARNRLWQAQLQRDMAVSSPGFSPDISSLIPDGVDVPQDVIDRINQGLSGLVPSVPSASAGDFTAGLNQAQYGVEIADANAAAAASSGLNQGSIGQANAALVSAQAALDRLENGASDTDRESAALFLAQAQNALDQARAARDRATLIAPFDGVIAQDNLTVGEPPPQQDAAVLLVNLDPLYVDLSVDETDVVSLEEGQPVALTFDALPDATLTGQVSEIAIAPVSVGELVSYPVRVRLDPTDQPVRIGMSATATITVRSLSAVLIVPNRFVRIDRTSGDAFVTIERTAGRFEEVKVELGVRNEIESEVTAGLTEGEEIVLLPRGTFDPFS